MLSNPAFDPSVSFPGLNQTRTFTNFVAVGQLLRQHLDQHRVVCFLDLCGSSGNQAICFEGSTEIVGDFLTQPNAANWWSNLRDGLQVEAKYYGRLQGTTTN